MQICAAHDCINSIQCRRALSQFAKLFAFIISFYYLVCIQPWSILWACEHNCPQWIQFALYFFFFPRHGSRCRSQPHRSTSHFESCWRESAHIFLLNNNNQSKSFALHRYSRPIDLVTLAWMRGSASLLVKELRHRMRSAHICISTIVCVGMACVTRMVFE